MNECMTVSDPEYHICIYIYIYMDWVGWFGVLSVILLPARRNACIEVATTGNFRLHS